MGEYANTPKAPEPSLASSSKTMSKVKMVLFGQLLALLLASVWASQSTMYLTCEFNAPAFSVTWVYLLMSFNLFFVIREGSSSFGGVSNMSKVPKKFSFLKYIRLQSSPWTYFGMAILLFYGNYLSLLAIKYTTITSISMIDAVSIPTVMVLSRCFLKRRYVKWHILAATVCMVGILVNLVVDLDSNKESDVELYNDGSKEYPHKIVGDLCALTAGILFGVNDVLTEATVRKNKGLSEYLGMIGFFGTFVAIVQMCITERAVVVSIFNGTTACSPPAMAGLMLVFVLGEVSRKIGVSYFLSLSEAALLQMSLLTSDVYTAIFSIIIQGIMPHGLFWVASVLVVSGILVYEFGPSPIVKEERDEAAQMDGIMNADVMIPAKGDVV